MTLSEGSRAAWDSFVSGHPQGTFFHQSAWRGVIERAFRHSCHFVFAEQDGAVVGILPLAEVKTRLFGHTLISLPFCVYGGPLAVDPKVAAALRGHAAALMGKRGAAAVEMRYREAPRDDWTAREALYVTFRNAITGDDEANLKAIPRKQRAVVRKGIERGLKVSVDGDVDGLHRIYAESVRNLGTPVFSRRYFRVLAEVFGEAMDVVTVSDGGSAVASVLNFYWRDEVLPYYGGGLPAARGCFANDFMYWETMRRAAARGARLFDFGRSKIDTGAYSFKKNWGFAPEPLGYRYRSAEGRELPQNNPNNPKYQRMIEAWKRLPLPVANAIGPFIVRGVG